MAELDVSVLNSTERGSGEMEELMKTASDSAIAHEQSEFVTAFEGGMPSSSCTTSAEERKTYGVWLEQVQRQCKSEEEFMTAISKPTWAEVAPLTSGSVEGSSSCLSPAEKLKIRITNLEFFQQLIKRQPLPQNKWKPCGPTPTELEEIIWTSAFFIDFGGRLEVGMKIAQGGQAEIYEALFDGKMAFDYSPEDTFVLKVFPLEHSKWFQHAWGKELESIYTHNYDVDDVLACCFVMKCTLLKDGRFAFLMRRYWGDLRKLINVQILKDKTHLRPPFPPSISTSIMYQIARGMRTLHDDCSTLHRDLKAANVLVRGEIERLLREDGDHVSDFVVADFESSEGVLGTGFWRAPEVLAILRSTAKDKYSDPTIWTKKVDVYAYGMTCYEVLSGCIPFQFRDVRDYNIGDERPPLPDYVDQEIQELLRKCWDSEPLKRPTFDSICIELIRFVGKKRKCSKVVAEDERDDEAKRWMKWPFNYGLSKLGIWIY